MQKRVIISIVLLTISFGVCALSFVMISNEIGKLRSSLYDAMYTAENYGLSDSATDAVLCDWKEAQGTLDLFLNERETDALGRLIPSLGDCLRENNLSGYLQYCVECIGYINAVFDDISLSVGSVF